LAETGKRLAEAERVELGGGRLVLQAVDLVGPATRNGGPERRRRSASSASPGPSPARGGATTITITSAILIAG